MKKLVKLFFAVVLTIGVSCGVNAQSVKIGHVDSGSIMQIMPEIHPTMIPSIIGNA